MAVTQITAAGTLVASGLPANVTSQLFDADIVLAATAALVASTTQKWVTNPAVLAATAQLKADVGITPAKLAATSSLICNATKIVIVKLGTLSAAIGGAWGAGPHGHMSDDPIPVTSPYGSANLITVAADDTAMIIAMAFMSSTHGDNDPGTVTFTWDNGGTNQVATPLGPTIKSSIVGGNAASVVYLFGLVNPTPGDHSTSFSWTNTTNLQEMYITAATFKDSKTDATAFYGYGTDFDNNNPAGTILDQVKAGALVPSSDMALSMHANSMVNLSAPIAWNDPADNATGTIIDLDGHVTNQAYAQYFRGNGGILNARADNADLAWWAAAVVAVRSASSNGTTVWLASAVLAPSGILSASAGANTFQATAVLAATSTLSAALPTGFRSTAGSHQGATGAGSVSTAVPPGVLNNDICLLTFSLDAVQGGFFGTITINGPAGFSQLIRTDVETPDGNTVVVWWKRCDGTESGNFTVTWSSQFNNADLGDTALVAMLFSGRHTTNPPVAGTWQNDNNGGSGYTSPQTSTAPAITAVAGDSIVFIHTPDTNTGDTGTSFGPAPTGFVDRQVGLNIVPGSGWVHYQISTQDNVSAGSTGTADGTFSFSSGVACKQAGLVRIPAAGVTTWQATAVLAADSGIITNPVRTPTFLQRANSTSGIVSFTNPIKAGSFIIVAGDFGFSGAATLSSVTNDKGDAATAVLAPTTAFGEVDWCYAFYTPTVGAQTVTVTLSGSVTWNNVFIWEVAGMASPIKDKVVHASGTGLTADSGSSGTLSNSLEVAVSFGDETNTFVAGDPNWEHAQIPGSGPIGQERILLSNAAINAQATTSGAGDDWGFALATFMTSAGATTWQGTAVLAATAILAANTIQKFAGIATLPAGSSLIVNTAVYRPAFATLAADSILSVNPVVSRVAFATLPADSILSADTKVYRPAFATLAADSIISATAILRERGFAILAADSSLSAFATIAGQVTAWPGTAVLAATAGIIANTVQAWQSTAVLPASAGIIANTQQIEVATAVLPCSSSIIANALRYVPAFATLPATGILSVDAKVYSVATATLPATGIVSAAPFLVEVARATLPLSSSLTLDAQVAGQTNAWQGSALLALQATLAANTIARVAALATLPADSSVIAGTVMVRATLATLSADSALTATTVQRWQSTAVLGATAALIADSIQRGQIPATAVLPAGSVLAATATQRWQAQSTLAAVGVLAGSTTQRWATTAQLNATAALLSTPTLKMLAVAKLAANSTIVLDALRVGKDEIFLTIPTNSSITVNATIPVRPSRRLINLRGNVVPAGRALTGRVNLAKTLRGDTGS